MCGRSLCCCLYYDYCCIVIVSIPAVIAVVLL